MRVIYTDCFSLCFRFFFLWLWFDCILYSRILFFCSVIRCFKPFISQEARKNGEKPPALAEKKSELIESTTKSNRYSIWRILTIHQTLNSNKIYYSSFWTEMFTKWVAKLQLLITVCYYPLCKLWLLQIC